MAFMRQQLITDGSFSEAEAMRLVRSLGERRSERLRSGAPARHAAITRTVENEVIPRLLETCLHDRPNNETAPQALIADKVEALTTLLLTGTQPQAARFVQTVQHTGISREQLFLNLFTQTARRLGVMWQEDDCNFANITIGMVRLSNVMQLVSHAFEAEATPVRSGPCALLVQAPGEQHGFGIAMVASFFRRAGWNVQSDPILDANALVSCVEQDWFSLVGLSVACINRLDKLADLIRDIRAASRNRAIGVMVGGSAFIEHPHRAEMVGADCTATDARLAVAQANALVSRLACQR